MESALYTMNNELLRKHKELPVFKYFEKKDILKILKYSTVTNYKAGDIIINEGSFDDRVYFLVSGDDWMWENDIFLTLFLGLSALLLAKAKSWWLRLLVLQILVLAHFLGISYGVFGILFILLFGLLPTRPLQLLAAGVVLLAFVEVPVYALFGTGSPFANRIYGQWYEWFALLAFVPLFLYDGTRGKYSKWFFYAYYPAHLGIIVLIGEIFR